MRKEIAEELFDAKYLPLLRQMYCCGFCDAIRQTIEDAEYQLWCSRQKK